MVAAAGGKETVDLAGTVPPVLQKAATVKARI